VAQYQDVKQVALPHDEFPTVARVHSPIIAETAASVIYVAIFYEKEPATAVTCCLSKLRVSVASAIEKSVRLALEN
jgi:hypothetical protein